MNPPVIYVGCDPLAVAVWSAVCVLVGCMFGATVTIARQRGWI